MKTEAIKVLFGAMALRRFSAKELREYVGANEHTVASVLGRQKDFFALEPGQPELGRPGRPAQIYTMTSQAVERLAALLSTFPAARSLTQQQTSQWSDAIGEDLVLARRYHDMYSSAPPGEERAEAWLWFEDAMAALVRQVRSYAEAGLALADDKRSDMEELSGILEAGFVSQPARIVEEKGFDETVLYVARQCFDNMWVSRTYGEGVRFRDLVDVRAIGTAAGSMGILAALGLTGKLVGAERVRAGLRHVVEEIDTKHLAAGLRRLLDPTGTAPARFGVLPAVAAGLRGCRTVLQEASMKRVLIDAAPSRPVSPVLRGSYLLALHDLPFEDFESHLEQVPPSSGDIETAWTLEAGPFGDAMDLVIQEAVEYDHRVTERFASRREADTDLEKLTTVFGSRQSVSG